MSVQPVIDPTCRKCGTTPVIETIIEGLPRDLGGFSVRYPAGGRLSKRR